MLHLLLGRGSSSIAAGLALAACSESPPLVRTVDADDDGQGFEASVEDTARPVVDSSVEVDVALDGAPSPDARVADVDDGVPGDASDAAITDAALPAMHAGFVELDPRDIVVDPRSGTAAAGRTSRARLFYSFVPGGPDPRTAPVFVFFNGGPGAATMSGLKMFGTGPWTLSIGNGSARLVPNDSSWTKLGNLLYIDARSTGFSYTVDDGDVGDAGRIDAAWDSGSTEDAVAGEVDLDAGPDVPEPIEDATVGEVDVVALSPYVRQSDVNFNAWVDAGDFVFALLRFLDAEPSVQDNPVVIVGESYGGIRATLMFSYLLKPSSLQNPTAHYRDPLLAGAIAEHYRHVFAEQVPIEGRLAARQFGAQVLIQPALAIPVWPRREALCSPRYALASQYARLGSTCQPWGVEDRCDFNIEEPFSWCDGLDHSAAQALTRPDNFTLVMGTPASDLVFGREVPSNKLLPWNFVSFDNHGTSYTVSAVQAFLDNVMLVRTLVTRALFDAVVVSDAIPDQLQLVEGVSAIIDRSDVSVARPGWIEVSHPHSAWAPVHSAKIRFPSYDRAAHFVTVTNPKELLEDVTTLMPPAR